MTYQNINTSLVSVVNGKAATTTLAIAKGTGNEHASVILLARKYLADLEEFGLVDFKSESTGGRPSEYAILSEPQATLILTYMRNSEIIRRFKVELVREFWRMADVLANPRPTDNSKITAELALAECYTRMLRPAPSSQVFMLQAIAKNNGLDPSFLPAYAIDAPSDATGGSSMPTQPISALLKDNGIKKGARAYNTKLQKAGLLEQRSRKSSGDSTKLYWSVTDRGLIYGKNITSPQNPRATQPHWYVERFSDMHDEVVRLTGGAA